MSATAKVSKPEDWGAMQDIRTSSYWLLHDLHSHLMRRDVQSARSEAALILERGRHEHSIERALTFLNDGLIGNAEAEIASLMFTRAAPHV